MIKNAVVTGASKGIGLAIVKNLLTAGYTVWGISRTPPESDLGTNFHWLKFDLENYSQIDQLVIQLPEKIDVLVNDAGLWELVHLKDVTPEHFDRTMNVNFRIPVFLTITLLSRFSTGATIINISSEMGIITEAEYGIYSASKAALDRFTTTLAKEQPNLKVLGILPASVDTPGARRTYNFSVDPERLTPEEVSQVVLQAISGRYQSGDLLLVTNNECLPYWETRDSYTVINVDGPQV